MEAELSKIRPHTSSNLPHQKAPATLLSALEATFKEQNTDASPAAYFAGLLTALESTVQSERDVEFKLGDGDILPAELYLLALVGPFVPPPIVRHHLNSLLSLTAPLWPSLNAHAPPLRSQLTLYNAILRALDRALLDNQVVRQSFSSILQLCVDARPKVRRRAADLVHDVLASPPSPLIHHPYSERVGEWVVTSLSEVNALGSTKQKAKKNAEDFSSAAIHLLTFIRPLLSFLPSSVCFDSLGYYSATDHFTGATIRYDFVVNTTSIREPLPLSSVLRRPLRTPLHPGRPNCDSQYRNIQFRAAEGRLELPSAKNRCCIITFVVARNRSDHACVLHHQSCSLRRRDPKGLEGNLPILRVKGSTYPAGSGGILVDIDALHLPSSHGNRYI